MLAFTDEELEPDPPREPHKASAPLAYPWLASVAAFEARFGDIHVEWAERRSELFAADWKAGEESLRVLDRLVASGRD